MTELITMTNKELSRYEVIKRLIRKEINGTEAAKQLNLSIRKVKRLKAKVKDYGAKGVIHGNRGKQGHHKMSEEIIGRAERIVKEKYYDFGPTFASEKLEENHQIKISKERMRQLMINWGLWKPRSRKKNKEYRSWRPRKEQYGEMEQFDGSYHEWVEKRGPKCCLLASIDDATSKITKAKFVSDEGVKSVFTFWRRYVKDKGKPIKVYLEKKGDLHRGLTETDKKNLEKIFSVQDVRVVNNDFTIRHKAKWFQLSQIQPTLVLRKDKVLIEKRIDDKIFISLRGKYLDYTELPGRPEKAVKIKVIGLTRAKPDWKPPADHPWRTPFIAKPKRHLELDKVALPQSPIEEVKTF